MMWKQHLLNNNWKFKDIVSAHKIDQLNKLLPHPCPVRNQLPTLYHFIFLTPSSASRDLDQDGYDSYQSPPSFKRRLWIGGSIKEIKPIQLGSEITLLETVKRVREINGSTMIEIERSIESDGDVLLIEMRRLMYMSSLYTETPVKSKEMVPTYTESVSVTSLDLMRYSALTYNSHKIHYDKDYASRVEKYPSLLIHGPLLVTLAVNFLKHRLPHAQIQNIRYKNIQPLFVDDELVLNIKEQPEGYHVWITNSKGDLCCSSVIC